MRARSIVVLAVVLLVACNGDSDAGGDRIPVDVLFDVSSTLPDDVTGVDLGDLGPDDDITFCEAFATTPTRWVDDAVVAVQWWIDAYGTARSTTPEPAAAPIDLLLDFGRRKLDWNLGRIEERPTWTSTEAVAAAAVADAAVDHCPDLPLVAGPPGRSDLPTGWADLSESEIDANCRSAVETVQEGIDWYTTEFGVAPRHQQQIETAAGAELTRVIEETGEYPPGVLYVGSDFVGVGDDGRPAPVPGGACDR